MRCAISGEVARDPVLCTKSGHVFERSLLQKHLERAGTDPITGDDASLDDVIAIKAANPASLPRASATSLPNMISAMQDEWDALMLETYSLRQQLHSTRKELSHSLYLYDAATRVIARLTEERDNARAMLTSVKAPPPPQQQQQPDVEMRTDDGEAEAVPHDGSDAVSQAITAKLTELSSTRKQNFKNPSQQLASAETLASFAEQSSHPLHLASKPGITCVDVHKTVPSLIASGGMDSRVVLFNAATHKVASTLKGHEKAVRCVALHPVDEVVVSGSDDCSVRVWKHPNERSKAFHEHSAFTGYTQAVTCVAMHPVPNLFGSASADGTWALHDLDAGEVVHRFTSSKIEKYTCGSFHPDGRLFAGGDAAGAIHIWDVVSRVPALSFEDHQASLTSVSFSENGFFVASGDSQGHLKLWDLRKQKSILDLALGDPVSCVRFNNSGHYLSVAAGQKISLYKTDKKLPLLTTIEAHSDPITGVAFGPDASFLASVSLDRNLIIFGAAESD